MSVQPATTPDLFAAVSQNRLLQDISPTVLAEVADLFCETIVDAEDVIVDEAGEVNRVYLILGGTVRISRATGTRQHTIAYLECGEFFGEIEFFSCFNEAGSLTGEPSSARVTAAVPTRLAYLDWAGFARLVKRTPIEIMRNVMRATGERYRASNDRRIEEILRSERLSLVGQMASTIVHDLKNPAGVIRNVATLLEEEAPGLDRAKMAGMLHRSADQMLGMIQDLLDFSRGTSSIHRQGTTVSALLSDLEEQVVRQLDQRRVRLVHQLNFTGEFLGDRHSLLRVFANLINNAVEAMPDGGTITLASDAADGVLVFTVSDTGSGIPEHLRARVFEPFVTHGKQKGTGLGLAITKSIVEAHGGQIELASPTGVGTTFRIVIPRK